MKSKLFLISLIFCMTVATADKFDQASRNTLEATNTSAPVVPSSTPNSSVVLDFDLATGESWDAQDDSDNVIASCISGGSITGFEWTNVTIETVGASWLSEATLLFSDTAVTNGINLTIGNGDDMAGTMTYSSGGILDLTDSMLPDIIPGMDGNFIMQIYESFDDNADAIDANFTAGTVTVYGIDLVGTPGPSCAFVRNADLVLTTANDVTGALDIGDTVIFTETLDNNGPEDVTNAVVTSTLSAGLDYVSNDCGASAVGQDVTWNVGSLANGANAVCNITTTVSDFGQLMLDAAVVADQADPDTANNVGTSAISGPVRIIPTLSQFGIVFMILSLFYIGRRKFIKS